jgi:hypothetical protein
MSDNYAKADVLKSIFWIIRKNWNPIENAKTGVICPLFLFITPQFWLPWTTTAGKFLTVVFLFGMVLSSK